jgi:hypothetical protein
MLQLKLMEKKKQLVRMDEVNELIDNMCGILITHLSSMPARRAPRGDLAVRRAIERVVFECRTEISAARWPTKCEPPLSEQ